MSVPLIPENLAHMVSKTETERNLYHQCLRDFKVRGLYLALSPVS